MSTITAKWTCIASTTRLKRSSQSLSVIANKAWIFGGELLPRQPVDNQFDVVELSNGKAHHAMMITIRSNNIGSLSFGTDYLRSG